jgi:DNA-binding NtrC family response regulator
MSEAMTVLAVDDEAPALDELAYMLQRHPAIGRVRTAADATLALRELHAGGVDAVFLDINMPGCPVWNWLPCCRTSLSRRRWYL